MAVFLLRFFAFRFHESPKFLMYRGKDEAAITVLQKVSQFNKRQCTLSLETLQSLTGDDGSMGSGVGILGGGKGQRKRSMVEKVKMELGRYKALFSNFTMARLTLLVWFTYMCDFWGFTLAGAFTPIILAKKNASDSTLDIYDTYRSYVYIYLPGILGVVLGVLGYDLPRVGRKWTMVFSSAMMAMSLFLFATVNNQASNIGLSILEYFFQSMFNAVLYGWTPEAFPSYIRGTACGFASFFGRLFSIVAPLAAQTLLPDIPTDDIPWQEYAKLLYLGGGVAFGATVFTAFLPTSKMNNMETM
ncbi:hypothetical protein MMC10_009433 [Thelotrema lepadinum]|nr:hypothetical protein [Thelotrema lepadinum]